MHLMVKLLNTWEAKIGQQLAFVLQVGDFEAQRHEADLTTTPGPKKYRKLGDFADFHTGQAVFPWSIWFIAGNHEPYGFLEQMPQGGQVANKCNYLGCVGSVTLSGLKVVGVSGIYDPERFQKKRPDISLISKSSKMRCIAVTNKKLRGIPRRMRALKKWASRFEGYYRPRSLHSERYYNWKIPVHIFLVEGRQSTTEIKAFCASQLLAAASHLALAANSVASTSYYRIACLLVWPNLHQSEVTIFYDQEYYENFLGMKNELAPNLISKRLSLNVPAGFLEHGHHVTQPDDKESVEWWCIGQPSEMPNKALHPTPTSSLRYGAGSAKFPTS
jgi:hypothetical protein